MRRVFIILIALLAALAPASALGQGAPTTDASGFAMRVNGDYRLPAGDSVNTVVVIGGDALIDGTVNDHLVVINGDAVVRGRVDGTATMVRGTITLASGSSVGDVRLIRSDIDQRQGATVTGEVTHSSVVWFQAFGVVAVILLTVGMGVMLFAGGAIFAGIGGRQLNTAASMMAKKPGQSILTAGIVAVGLPVATVGAMVTVVGIPVALAMIFVVGPLLTFLGLVVAGTWLGSLVLRHDGVPKEHPYGETTLGILILLLGFLVPGIGAPTFLLLGLWGTGALVYMAWRGMRPERPRPVEAPPAAAVPPPGGVQPT